MTRTLLIAAAFAAMTGSALAAETGTINAWGARFDVPAGQAPVGTLASGADRAVGSYVAPIQWSSSRRATETASLAYRYSGQHAGGPADALIPGGTPRPVEHHAGAPAYRYSGQHAGGPADALIPDGSPKPVEKQWRAPAYRYAGSHAGGPANDLPRD
ncbi:hypothetical protein [Methylobacterium durans]|uniref:Uncharacterized protein n=1 Tax=Methylobacterium durans TaxID=2202825 RepID=A0A2U8W8E7_9HYPH|nr:hypothetical protein [Methylobacterium durans]AWN42299.1 hypothetical protein DK389_19645 [Methylobacterium durans]